MGLVIDRSSVSTLAKKLKAAQTGKNLTHQQLLEAIAQGLGFSNYGALNHHLSSATAGKDASFCHASCSMRLPDGDLSIPVAVKSGESWKRSAEFVSRSPDPFTLDNLPKDPMERDLVIVALAKDLCSDSRGMGDSFWTNQASRALSVLISFYLAKVAIDSWSNILEQPDGKENFLLEFVDWYVEARIKTFEADSNAPSREFFRVVLVDANLANHKALKQEGKEVHFEWHIGIMNDLSIHPEKTLASILMTMECALSKISPEIGLSISKLSPLWGFMSKKSKKNKSAYDDEPLSPFEVIIRSSETFSIRETNHAIAQLRAEEFFQNTIADQKWEIVSVSPAIRYNWAFSRITSEKTRFVDLVQSVQNYVVNGQDLLSDGKIEFSFVFELDVLMWAKSAQEAHHAVMDFVMSQLPAAGCSK